MSSGTFGTNWLDLSNTSNCYNRTYVQGFVDISGGNLILRNNNMYITGGDLSLNGRLFAAYTLDVSGTINTNSGYNLSYSTLPTLTSNMIGYTIKTQIVGVTATTTTYPGFSCLTPFALTVGVWLLTGSFGFSTSTASMPVFHLFSQTTTPISSSTPILSLPMYQSNSTYSGGSISTVVSTSSSTNIYFYCYNTGTTMAITGTSNSSNIMKSDNFLYAVRIA